MLVSALQQAVLIKMLMFFKFSLITLQPHQRVFAKTVCCVNNTMTAIYFQSSIVVSSIPEKPGESCFEIKTSEGEHAVNGIYWLKPAGSTTLQVNSFPIDFISVED